MRHATAARGRLDEKRATDILGRAPLKRKSAFKPGT